MFQSGELTSVLTDAGDLTLASAVDNLTRSAKFVARDKARHPLAELTFFGLAPGSAVVEIWPGGGYWTEILAPFLRDKGAYHVALQGKGVDAVADAEASKLNALFRAKVAADPATSGKIEPTVLGVGQDEIAPPGSADFVLSFRNLHNWMKDGFAPEAFAAFYRALKPGGVLGLEEHRGQRDTAARSESRGRLRPARLRHRACREGGFRVCRRLRDQRQSQGHGELAEGSVDSSSNSEARRPGQSQV